MEDKFNEIKGFIDESIELLNTDFSTFPAEDQLLLMCYYVQFINKIKPIYVKNMAKDPKQTFLFKM